MVSTSCFAGDVIVLSGEAIFRGSPTRHLHGRARRHATCSAGIAETDLQDEVGNTFKGVSLRHLTKPWIEYECAQRLAFNDTEQLMGTNHHVREGQAQMMLDYRREEPRRPKI